MNLTRCSNGHFYDKVKYNTCPYCNGKNVLSYVDSTEEEHVNCKRLNDYDCSICFGCMESITDNLVVCPKCGYVVGTVPIESFILLPGTILNNRYIIGKALGQDGFAVTYLAYDISLEQKVAIKEYMPLDFSIRTSADVTVAIYSDGNAQEQFSAGLSRFIQEARRLARFNGMPGIVNILDFFEDNNTGYTVMEYLNGQSVKSILNDVGLYNYEDAKRIILSVLHTLKRIHKEGIIHRDISPDNIFINYDGSIKIVDFGAARYLGVDTAKSLSVILKPGYAAEEQYRSRGNQGPWTDVYSVACTFYEMLTGVTPEEAMERSIKDTLCAPSALNVKLPLSAENAIMNALNVKIEDRTQSVDVFIDELTSDNTTLKQISKRGYDAIATPVVLKIMFLILTAPFRLVYNIFKAFINYILRKKDERNQQRALKQKKQIQNVENPLISNEGKTAIGNNGQYIEKSTSIDYTAPYRVKAGYNEGVLSSFGFDRNDIEKVDISKIPKNKQSSYFKKHYSLYSSSNLIFSSSISRFISLPVSIS